MTPTMLRNRRRLLDFMEERESFTEADVTEMLRAEKEDSVGISPVETISEYLKDLVDIGALQYKDGRYTVVAQELHRNA